MSQVSVAAGQRESYSWLTCELLTEDEPWQPQHDETADYVRVIAWADESSSKRALHKLTELGVKRFLRSPRPWMFHLTRLEAEDEIGRFSQYFIAREGLYNVMHSSIVLAKDDNEGDDEYIDRVDKGVKENQAFMITNGFLAPNGEDISELRGILSQGLAITHTGSLR